MAQKPYIIRSLGPKALKYESLEPQGKTQEMADPVLFASNVHRGPESWFRVQGYVGLFKGVGFRVYRGSGLFRVQGCVGLLR